MFHFIGVLGSVRVDTFHATAFGGTVDTGLGGVDVIVDTVEEGDGDHGGDTLEEDLHVLEFVDLTGTHGVIVQGSHGPAERALLQAEFGMEPLLSFSHALLVGQIGVLVG